MHISEVRSNHVTLSQQSQSNRWSIANEPELFRLIVDGPTQVEIQPIALRCASQWGEGHVYEVRTGSQFGEQYACRGRVLPRLSYVSRMC